MGYLTYRVFRQITLEQLKAKTEANLALYEPSSEGTKVRVTGFQGDGCSALLMGYMLREEQILRPIGFQFGCVWMDVRYQDGDAWDLTIMEGSEHKVSHNVNPWAFEPKVDYNQEHIDYRINRVCEFWPRQGEALRPYLLPWRVPTKTLGVTRFTDRKGKAHESDTYGYGSANQIADFMRRFGIHDDAPKLEIGHIAEEDAE